MVQLGCRQGAFYNCSSLTSIIVPDSVTDIASGAFSACSSLESITLPFAGATKDGTEYTSFDYIFSASSHSHNYVPRSLKSVTITSGESIGRYAFSECSSLTSITIPDSVKEIGGYAFSKCSSLTSITIPDSVKEIGEYAFSECSSLATINIPKNVKNLEKLTFNGCSSLVNITIPDSVKSIESSVFNGCSSLASITVGAKNKNYKSIDGNLYSKNGKKLIKYAVGKTATSFTIPNGVKSIAESAFSHCSSLSIVTIPNSVTSIGEYAFAYCDSLKSITIPKRLKIINKYTFYYCSALKSVTIPKRTKMILEYAFGRTSLESINYNGKKAKWDSISKPYYNWNYNTGNYTVHCTDGDISKAKS